MSVATAIIAIVSFWIAVKAFKFFRRGGAFTLPAVNSTHLYYQIRKVYDKMEPGCAAYFALFINSAAVRNQFSERCLLTMVRDFKSDDDWADLCSMYVCMWQERVSGKYISPKQICELGLYDKVVKAIERSKMDILSGGSQYDKFLRDMNQSNVFSVVVSYREFMERNNPS